MNLLGKTVHFYLTEDGKAQFGQMVSKKGSFKAVVLASDGLGAWVLFPGLTDIPVGGNVPTMLVKWEYVLTVVFEFQPEPPPAKEAMGFIPGRPRV